jgi:hypothetical protein
VLTGIDGVTFDRCRQDRVSVEMAWHEKALAEDQAAYRANPAEGSSWSDVKARISGKP